MLEGLVATPETAVTILSDGAEGSRSSGEAASFGPVQHVLDWFHLSMRIQHVAQTNRSWRDATHGDRQVSPTSSSMSAGACGMAKWHERWI